MKPAGNLRPSSAGSRCCASIMPATGSASPPISCRRPGSVRGRRCSPPTRMTQMRPGGARHRMRCANGPGSSPSHYYALAAQGDPRRRPRRALFRRPAADLLRPGGGAGDGALCRRDRHQLQCRQPATAGSRTIIFDGLEKLSGGKPVLVSEWFFAAQQNRTGNRNNGHLMTVETQAERAAGAAAATENFAAIPEIVGAHWFQYYDHPKGGRAGRRGLRFRPRRHQRPALSAADRGAGDGQPQRLRDPCRRARREPARASGRFCVPHAAIALARPLAVRLAEAGEPAAAADAVAGRGRFRRGLSDAGAGAGCSWRRSARIISTSICWPMTAPFPLERGLPGRARGRCRRRAAALHLVLHPAAHQDPRLSGNGRPSCAPARRRRRSPGLHPGRRRQGGLFRRRPAAHHRRGAHPVVGAGRRRRPPRAPSCASRSPSPPGTATAGCRCRAALRRRRCAIPPDGARCASATARR